MGIGNAMAVGHESESRIAKLLNDSHYANEGALLARESKNMSEYHRLMAKAKDLLAKAHRIDPAQNAAAWQD